ncbi:hypothetical protein PP304_gp112 [Gordonia phage Phendrix]|uniref:Uncharacterized protein n=1 Tax=Gordonia phage Phendrix TaxID=2593335 RepID=A0A514U140_9CAUD|nr:hypothetical protein PP304_gp112 [Gordonia phage Phendrix]QDK02660.1 hypothetical protein SEA_PHENDRIX_112 [Gordonia phage Phendrix]
MSKCLITGMTAGQTHESSKKTGLTVAGAMASALRDRGHTVDVRPYSLTEEHDIKGFDKVFVGIGPLKGLGCGYAYGAMDAIVDTLEVDSDRLCLYLDDTGTGKIGSEIRTITTNPMQYTKPFFSYRKEYQMLVDDPVLLGKHLQAIDMLHGDWDWYPPMLVPSWTFDLGFAASQKICNAAAFNTVTFDPSVMFGRELESNPGDDPYWGTLHQPEATVKEWGEFEWPVEFVPRTEWDVLEHAWGCLIPGSTWSPELFLAARAGIPVCANWRVLGPEFGPPFEALPQTVETMHAGQREDLAKQQAELLLTEYTTKQHVIQVLEGLL